MPHKNTTLARTIIIFHLTEMESLGISSLPAIYHNKYGIVLTFYATEMEETEIRLLKKHFGPFLADGEPPYVELIAKKDLDEDFYFKIEISNAFICEVKEEKHETQALSDYEISDAQKEIARLSEMLQKGTKENVTRTYECKPLKK